MTAIEPRWRSALVMVTLCCRVALTQITPDAMRSDAAKVRASWKWDHVAGHVVLDVAQPRGDHSPLPLVVATVDVALIWADGSDTTTIRLSDAWEQFYIPSDATPYRVELDPLDKLSLTLSFDKSEREIVAQLRDGGVVARRRAASSLWSAESNTVADALGTTLRDDRVMAVRQSAARSLGSMRTQSARDYLLASLDDDDAAIRRSLVQALSHYRGSKVVAQAVTTRYFADSTAAVRAAIVTTMGRLNVVESYSFVSAALNVNWEAVVIESALVALGEMGQSEALQKVKRWASDGLPAQTRPTAIAQLHSLTRGAPFRRREVKKFLMTLTSSGDADVRAAAYTALGKMGGNEAVLTLERAYASDKSELGKRAAYSALQTITFKYR